MTITACLAATAVATASDDDDGGGNRPKVDAVWVTDIGPTSVTLRGQTSRGLTFGFELGTSKTYNIAIPGVLAVNGYKQQIVAPAVALQPGTTYHFRLVASNVLTSVPGSDATFTTAPASGAAAPAPAPASGSGGSGPGSSAGSGSSGSGSGSANKGGSKPGSDPSAPAPGADDEAATYEAPHADDHRPQLGRSVGVAPVTGSVRVEDSKGRLVSLEDTRNIPTGATIDARRGTVALTAATNTAGATQTARFWGGVFQVRQPRKPGGMTELVLRGGSFADCGKSRGATAAASHKKRSLWGSDRNGRFQTRGRSSVATVRGTRWYTEDTCAGTVTRVVEGAVSVRELKTGRKVLVRAGQRHLARH